MVLETLMQELGPQKRWPNGFKAKQTQGGPSGSSPLRSDGSRNGQLGAVLRICIRIRMDPNDFGLLDPHPESAF
jgi:hypothetical protein